MGVYPRGKAESAGDGSGACRPGDVVSLSDRRPFRGDESVRQQAWVQHCRNCVGGG